MMIRAALYSPSDLWLVEQPRSMAEDDHLVLAQLRPFTDCILTPDDPRAALWPALFVARADITALLNLWPAA